LATGLQVAKWITETFDPYASRTVEEAATEALVDIGNLSPADAAVEAERLAAEVSQHLSAMQGRPFEFSARDPRRLIGVKRRLAEDSAAVRDMKDLWGLWRPELEVIAQLDPDEFERLCAGAMRLSGATRAVVTGGPDDGGIDLYGRIPIRPPDQAVREKDLLRTALLDRELLFLGQCKRYDPAFEVGPGEINQFRGAVERCLNKYEGAAMPPALRVPEHFYRRNETCLALFFTTAKVSDKARDTAKSVDIITLSGQDIGEFLSYRRVGVRTDRQGELRVERDALIGWLETHSETA